ncbi:TPA: conjugal transfer protein TrbH [Pseudomonas aeruginosa]|uniref:TrbH mating pair formation protein n=1 Tax=Pseudomonas TaxID=286 RepID=UPI0002870914|nr:MULTISPECIES: TrbH mating pair formation protein [Pseudomonas]AFS51524.1 TrbH mating pair formation protein [uncultured bacterium]EKT4503793.1 conjugal transfer protein TrbH [Pseudomonas putida]EKT4508288.1 conjugal transfer protein TrbH [Pseudomonas putida]MCE0853693.1 conjugal transfer protein TrbH [Pseudomonas asiatica]MCS8001538.1 conjugal transfer protein TrbH [Pseudomonas aeruginosa]
MRKIATIALLAVLAGCASKPYGNFLENAPLSTNQKLAADSVKQLVAVYPPASTRLNLVHEAPDAYGRALVSTLRARGYALQEVTDEAAKKPVESKPAPATAYPASPGLALSYVIDNPTDTNLYRVTLTVGSQSLTRAYVAQNNTVHPAGEWTRKE